MSKYIIDSNTLTDIADAIREEGFIITDHPEIATEDMANRIRTLQTGGVEINENGQLPVKGLAYVDVNVPQGVFPSGSIDITENGTYNVENIAQAVVDVPAEGVPWDDVEVEILTTYTTNDHKAQWVDLTALFGLPTCDIASGYYAFRLTSIREAEPNNSDIEYVIGCNNSWYDEVIKQYPEIFISGYNHTQVARVNNRNYGAMVTNGIPWYSISYGTYQYQPYIDLDNFLTSEPTANALHIVLDKSGHVWFYHPSATSARYTFQSGKYIMRLYKSPELGR